jgi:hypothetical protein
VRKKILRENSGQDKSGKLENENRTEGPQAEMTI